MSAPVHEITQLHHVLLVTAILVQGLSASKTTTKTSKLNGWYPWSEYISGTGSSDVQAAECATYLAPLCYPGVFEAPEWMDQTVDIFVKRLPSSDPKTATNMWLLQGDPGFASNDRDGIPDDYAVPTTPGSRERVYMDHRGTGRSTFQDCATAQAITSGSPRGKSMDPSEVPTCAKALEDKYGDLVSFSTTSAAKDLVALLSEFTNGENIIVYSTSYARYW
ncbi:Alpha/Beta hydrolase fold [Phytophthora cactorum]|nr:Alpha/Beta hydrolase fold [Phytophthora cactorum]